VYPDGANCKTCKENTVVGGIVEGVKGGITLGRGHASVQSHELEIVFLQVHLNDVQKFRKLREHN